MRLSSGYVVFEAPLDAVVENGKDPVVGPEVDAFAVGEVTVESLVVAQAADIRERVSTDFSDGLRN